MPTLGLVAEVFERIRIADVLDVVLVAALIYSVLSWLRGASRAVVYIIVSVVCVFVVTRLLNMYLTQMLVEQLLPMFAIAFVVVFQSDIRRMFDRLTTWWFLHRRGAGKATSPALDTVTAVATRLAGERTGALIVIRGQESLHQAIQGGVELNGQVSEALLLSIFSPSTPGHDGAVLIDDSRITMFGAQLPLSANLGQVGNRGTRHTAALGMSEVCDALVIVVSEEHGDVSIARRGRLTTLASPAELREELDRFWQETHAAAASQPRRRWERRDVGVAAISVGLAVLLWTSFAYEGDTVFQPRTVPIEFRNLPPQFVFDGPVPDEARVTLAGSPQALRRVGQGELVVRLDLRNAQEGANELTILEEDLDLPQGVRMFSVDPRTVQVLVVPRPAEPRAP